MARSLASFGDRRLHLRRAQLFVGQGFFGFTGFVDHVGHLLWGTEGRWSRGCAPEQVFEILRVSFDFHKSSPSYPPPQSPSMAYRARDPVDFPPQAFLSDFSRGVWNLVALAGPFQQDTLLP